MCSHCCPTLRTHSLRKLCALNHLLPAPLPSWNGTEVCQSGQLDKNLLSQKRHPLTWQRGRSPPTMGYCTGNGGTALWQPELPHHLFFKSELFLFQEGAKESLKLYPTVPIRCAHQWTLMCTCISNTRVRLVIPSGCMPLIHKIPPYISPCPLTPLTLSPPCLHLPVMEADLGVPVPVIFHPRQKIISAVSRKVVTAPKSWAPFPSAGVQSLYLLGNQPSHRWERPPALMCAHHMGHFIYIAGSTHLYLVCLRGHHGIRKLKMKMEYNVWELSGGIWVKAEEAGGNSRACLAVWPWMLESPAVSKRTTSWGHLWIWTRIRFRPLFKHKHPYLSTTWNCKTNPVLWTIRHLYICLYLSWLEKFLSPHEYDQS